MTSGIYDADGLTRLTASPGSGFCGRYAPDGSFYYTLAPGSGFCGSTAPDGSLYVVDATGSPATGSYASNGALRVTSNKTEFNGALRVSGILGALASWDASTSTLAQLTALASVSRPSLATMFDSTGKLTYGPNNLLTYSNTFSNAAWASLNGGTGTAPTITSGQTDPLGGSGAWRLLASRGASNTTSDYSLLYQDSSSGKSGTNYSSGIWIKSNTGSPQTVTFYINSTGAVSSTTTVTASIAWTFVSAAKITADGTALGFKIGARGGSYGGDATIDVLIYSAVSAAVTYETTPRTADQVITTAAAYYGPRFDYSYNGAAWVPAGLLVEGAATNLIVRSGDQSNASWSVLGGTVTPLAGAAPDGVSSAYTLALSGASLSGVRQLLSWTAGNTGTFTFYVRSSSSGGAANVRLTTNNSVAWSTGITTKLALTSQWQRITLSGALTSSGTQIFTIVGNANADGTVDATCAGNVDVAFAKLEVGAMATSYIPTAASSVTRAADALTAASLSTNPAIIQYRDVSSGTRARKVVNPWSGISSEQNEWIEAFRIYPSGTSSTWLNAHLTVDGAW